MPRHTTSDDRQNWTLPADPRLRVTLAAPLVLSADWHRLDFGGESSLNLNTFPVVDDVQLIRWDGGSDLFRFTAAGDRNTSVQVFYRVTAGDDAAVVQARFVVPAGNGIPSPIHFPFPESVGRIDLCRLSADEEWADEKEITTYATAAARLNGLGVEVRTRTSLASYPTMNECILTIYGG